MQKSKDGESDLLINKEKCRLVGVFIGFWARVPHRTLRSCNRTRYLETLTQTLITFYIDRLMEERERETAREREIECKRIKRVW